MNDFTAVTASSTDDSSHECKLKRWLVSRLVSKCKVLDQGTKAPNLLDI